MGPYFFFEQLFSHPPAITVVLARNGTRGYVKRGWGAKKSIFAPFQALSVRLWVILGVKRANAGKIWGNLRGSAPTRKVVVRQVSGRVRGAQRGIFRAREGPKTLRGRGCPILAQKGLGKSSF